MEDELLNGQETGGNENPGGQQGQDQNPVAQDPTVTNPAKEGEEEFVPSPKEAGYPVTKLGFIANMEARTDAKQKKSDAAINMHAATALTMDVLTMDVLEATVLKGTNLLLKVNVTPYIANCPKLTWISSDESVAVVDDMLKGNGIREDGIAMVYAVGLGTAVISATSESGLTCSMSLEVAAEEEPEPKPIEVGSKYAFVSYSDAAEPLEYAHGTVEVLSTTKKLAKIVVLTNEPDDPEATWVGREFYVDRSVEVGDGNKYPLYTNTSKTVVPGVVVEITEKVEEA